MKRVLLACLLASLPVSGGDSFVDIGSGRQLFLDRHLIDEMRGSDFELHRPVLREEVLRYDKPWEGDTSWHPIVIRDGDRFRMWYRVSQGNHDGIAQTAYAESRDGILWERPPLGLVESQGSTDNNLVWPTPGNQGINMCVFKDPNPGVPEGERYKAIVQTRDIHGLVSADGLRWTPIQPDPLIRRLQDQVNDGPHAAFWDPWQSRYVVYKRGWWGTTPEKQLDASGTSGEANRTIRRFTSPDFRNWDGPEWVEIPFGTQPREQFYTSAAIPYPWARNVYLMLGIIRLISQGWSRMNEAVENDFRVLVELLGLPQIRHRNHDVSVRVTRRGKHFNDLNTSSRWDFARVSIPDLEGSGTECELQLPFVPLASFVCDPVNGEDNQPDPRGHAPDMPIVRVVRSEKVVDEMIG